uniref:Aggregate spidroin 2 n=2 Tax=Latrodectus hesperus TaxID=256737 RepID=A0A514KFQ5_LATHE|nr:aggregate spidroin 2 [Latrodectus hesperus]
MGCSAVAILALCLISINVQTFAQEDTDPFDFNETNEEFGKLFVNNLIESGVFGQTDDKDFNAVTESLLNAIKMLTKGQNAPASTKKTFMMAFASSLAELIVQESDNALSLVEKTRAVTDAMRKAYMQTSGNPNEALIQKVDFLVGIFLDVQQSAEDYEYDTIVFEDEMPLPLEIVGETLPNMDPSPGHPDIVMESPPEVTPGIVMGPGNDIKEIVLPQSIESHMDEPETYIGEVDKMIKFEQDAPSGPNAPEEQIQQIMLPGMSQPGEDNDEGDAQKIIIPDSSPLEEIPIPSAPVPIPSLNPFNVAPFPIPNLEPIDAALTPILDPFMPLITPAISPPKLEEPPKSDDSENMQIQQIMMDTDGEPGEPSPEETKIVQEGSNSEPIPEEMMPLLDLIPEMNEPIEGDTIIEQKGTDEGSPGMQIQQVMPPKVSPESSGEQVINLPEPQISPTKDLIGPFGMPGQVDILNQPQISPFGGFGYPYPMIPGSMPENVGDQQPFSNPFLQNLMKKFNPTYLFGSPYQGIGLNAIEQTFNVVLRNGETYIPAIMSAIIESKKTAPQTLDLRVLVNKLSPLFSDMTVENFYLSRTEIFIELILEALISSLEIIRMADDSCINKVSAITSPYKYVNAFNDILF